MAPSCRTNIHMDGVCRTASLRPERTARESAGRLCGDLNIYLDWPAAVHTGAMSLMVWASIARGAAAGCCIAKAVVNATLATTAMVIVASRIRRKSAGEPITSLSIRRARSA